MALLAFGFNHNTAPLAFRERVAIVPEQASAVLQALHGLAPVQEVALLSTCNRTEFYCTMEPKQVAPLLDWLHREQRIAPSELARYGYQHWDEAAARHLMRVACGLDSMVLGEPQILGQVKTAFTQAQQADTLGTVLGRAFQHTFAIAKQVRTETDIGRNPVSVAFAAVSLAKRVFSDLANSEAVLVGAGETIELVAQHLQRQGVRRMIIANRSADNARQLAEQFGAEAIALSDLADHLHRADILVSSTASQIPVVGKGAVERAVKARRHRPMFMVDIAVPRDIEPEVADMEDVYLYTIDDLKQVIEENLKSRSGAAQEAEHLVQTGALEFMRQLQLQEAVASLTEFRRRSDALREAEQARALTALANGADPEQVVQQLARALTNKLIHTPTVQLRKAASEGRHDVKALFNELFQLDLSESNNDTDLL